MSNLDKQVYQRRVENRRIEMAVLETAKEESFEKGIKEGIKETAKNCKKLGFSIEDIIKATGLTIDEIEKL
ncbi:MAG: hypothetical protein EAY69_11780 [Cytophagales bacterium]|nr:MAG: hypothetical protein EAY69_11780 [Cytophagales bacterium]